MEQTITVSDIARLDIRPGQVLVVTLPENVTQMDVERALAMFTKALPDTHIIVTRQGVTMQTIGTLTTSS